MPLRHYLPEGQDFCLGQPWRHSPAIAQVVFVFGATSMVFNAIANYGCVKLRT